MTERFDLATLPWQAWKNGAGRTQEIAVEPRGAGLDHFDWRVSVAEVGLDAPFSAFPGIDRCILLWRGAGLCLRSDDGRIDHRLDEPLQPFRFAGETPLRAQLIGGTSTDLNVMTRRGRWCAELQVLDKARQLPGADALILLAAAGAWSVDDVVVAPGQGLVWRAPGNGAVATPAGGDARLLAVRLERSA